MFSEPFFSSVNIFILSQGEQYQCFAAIFAAAALVLIFQFFFKKKTQNKFE